jgi:F420-dependent oxidoreductase-like protein
MTMRLRVLLEARHGATYDQTLAMARATEEAGFDAFFRSDHFLGIDPNHATLVPTDAWVTLAGLARDTTRVRLGTLVSPVTFRLPGALAVTVATVDAMSGGRVELGMGAGWYALEHAMFGIPLPPLGERLDMLEEQLAIVTGLWATPVGERFSHDGRRYRIDECRNVPRPAQSPHPPVIVGGTGAKRSPRLAARFADEYSSGFPGGAAERFAAFGRICEESGRDPASVRRSVVLPVCCGSDDAEVARRAAAMGRTDLLGMGVCGGPDAVLDKLGEIGEAGVDTVYLHIYDVDDLDHVRLLGSEVLARAR